ncbi:MAG: hypothetical protein HRT57_12285 [Crocinitomicaceae bacterium]|nr:hypothetical protein [Crocinitomicaceae bacterium]
MEQFQMMGRDAIILQDRSALLIGNGPLYGIKSTIYDPSISLIRTDSLLSNQHSPTLKTYS